MKKVAVLIANGTEEIEVLTPVDVLRRADGVVCDLISVSGREPKCSHGVSILADKVIEEVTLSSYDAVVIPGGMPGALNISSNEKVISSLKQMEKDGKLIASICASPAVVLKANGLFSGKLATCYPAEKFVKLLGEDYTGEDVQVCDNLITANGPKSALKFALEICKALSLSPKF